MLQFFQDGGWSMFVIVSFGLVALGSAAYQAVQPDERHEGFLGWMARGVLWSSVAGVASDIGTTCHATCRIEDGETRARATLEGVAESMSPLIMGFAFLALVALLAAVGRRRLDARRG